MCQTRALSSLPSGSGIRCARKSMSDMEGVTGIVAGRHAQDAQRRSIAWISLTPR
jgi:hypothetical protein